MSKTGQKKLGRPIIAEAQRRTEQVAFYVTEGDFAYMDEIARNCGFRSRSSLCAAIFERLCAGGFSGLSFAKIGLQFANLPVPSRGLYFGVRPFPPLIGDDGDPSGAQIMPFLEGIKTEARKENEK